MKKCIIFILIASMLLSLAACSGNNSEPDVSEQKSLAEELGLTKETKVATENTIKINSALYTQLDFADTQEAAFATKGLIDAPETLELKDADGHVVWSQSAYSFLEDYEKAPDSVNPSLWENTKNNHAYGLFEVTDGIYQVRGYDMANLTVIESDNGWIVFDPLMSVECTEAAMQLMEKNLGKRSVVAVIISHPHIDHFGGIKGVMTADQAADPNQSLEQQLASGKIPIIVPEGFEEHAISENVYVGQAMGRRATYQYGVYLDPSVTGTLGIGIGMGQSVGSISYISPTFEITYTGRTPRFFSTKSFAALAHSMLVATSITNQPLSVSTKVILAIE
jgi:alkyl sulfatase BDS1-like metallo-beta-lactamase superfamily hydrolase